MKCGLMPNSCIIMSDTQNESLHLLWVHDNPGRILPIQNAGRAGYLFFRNLFDNDMRATGSALNLTASSSSDRRVCIARISSIRSLFW